MLRQGRMKNKLIIVGVGLVTVLGLGVRYDAQSENNITLSSSSVAMETVSALPQKEFTNFDKGDIEKNNITKLIVKKTAATEVIINSQDVVSQKEIKGTDRVAIEVKNTGAAATIVAAVVQAEGNDAVEEDAKLELFASYNDPYYSSQGNLVQMSMASAWPYFSNASSMTIAFVDTGIRGTHEDLTGRVAAGYNVLTDHLISANSSSDDNGHGTAMASAAAATANNAKGLVGVAYTAQMMPIKAFNSSGSGLASDAAIGINWAAEMGAKVINLSFGSSSYSSALHNAIVHARSHGCIVVAAAGNSGSSLAYPGSDAYALTVGSVNSSNARSSFSNYGGQLDVMAPGESVRVASRSSNSSYATSTGTSVSTAQVSGMVALAMRWHSGSSTNEVMEYLRQSAKKTTGMGGALNNNYYGWGVANYNNLQTKVGNYSYSVINQSGSTTLANGSSNRYTLYLRNNGRSSWRSGTVNLGTSHNRDRTSVFTRECTDGSSSGWISSNRVRQRAVRVAPGGTAIFTFCMKNSGVGTGNYNEYFQPIVDGLGWMADTGIYWRISVPTQYSYEYVAQNANPSLRRGRSYKFVLRIKNTGSQTWYRNRVNLGTSHNQDRIPLFLREGGDPSGWISGNRIRMLQSSVASGATATFEFYMKVPTNMSLGSHYEYFQPVVDGVGWMPDKGIFWRIYVSG